MKRLTILFKEREPVILLCVRALPLSRNLFGSECHGAHWQAANRVQQLFPRKEKDYSRSFGRRWMELGSRLQRTIDARFHMIMSQTPVLNEKNTGQFVQLFP